MKKRLSIVYKYLCFITELDFLTLLGTFLRLIIYGRCISLIIMKEYSLALFMGVMGIVNFIFSILRFKLYETMDKNKFKKVNKKFKKRVYKSKVIELEDLPKDEQIIMMEEFIQSLKELQEEAEQDLIKLKGEDN